MKTTLTVLAVFCLATLAGTANAAIIFDNFGPGNSYDTVNAYSLDSAQKLAKSFTLTEETTVVSATVPIDLTGSLLYGLFEADGQIPGSALSLSLWTKSGPISASSGMTTLTTGTSGTTLQAGSYFLVLQSLGSSSLGAWYQNDIGQTGGFAATSPWQPSYVTTPAVRIESNAVPEPATLSLLAVGGLPLLRRRR